MYTGRLRFRNEKHLKFLTSENLNMKFWTHLPPIHFFKYTGVHVFDGVESSDSNRSGRAKPRKS